MLYTEMMDGFKERIRNIAVFAPLFELKQKRKYDYSLLELGIATMLFILEKMLQGEKDCTYERIAYFLQDLIQEYYKDELSYDEALELSHYLVRESLMNQGKPHQLEYINFETGEDENYRFHLVELQDYEIDDRTVRLKLSTAGLELLFKTKEMYNELQVSISQLYLRQQVQKGIFDGALRSVEELALAVKNERERIKKLEERIIRDVLEVAKEGEYEKELERINAQLNREQKMFYELKDLVDRTMESYYQGNVEDGAVDKVMKLKNKLIDVMQLHETLFTAKLKVEDLMEKSIESMILNAFNTKVNFETEFLEATVRNDVGIDKLKKLLEPLFSTRVNTTFNLNRIFEKQRVFRRRKKEEKTLWKVEEEQLRKKEEEEFKEQKEKERKMKEYLLMILKPLVESDELRLGEIINRLKERDYQSYETLMEELDFYPFIIKLHQAGEIPLESKEEQQGFVLDDLFWVLTDIVASNREIAELEGFELVATDELIQFENGYVMSEFVVRVVSGSVGVS